MPCETFLRILSAIFFPFLVHSDTIPRALIDHAIYCSTGPFLTAHKSQLQFRRKEKRTEGTGASVCFLENLCDALFVFTLLTRNTNSIRNNLITDLQFTIKFIV